MKDPRKEPDYNPRLFPSCDGSPFGALPPSVPLRTVKLQFLAAYYRLNVAYARLVACCGRRAGRSAPRAERALLQAIEKALLAKEALEDRYATRGILAAPLYRDGFAIDVQFQHSGTRPLRPIAIRSSASRSLSFALPPRARHRRAKA